MEKFITDLHIQNFKSIKDISLDCSRINLFIGRPNVGKSNVLEALSLFQAPITKEDKPLSDFIRYEDTVNLFYNNDPSEHVKVKTNLGNSYLRYHYNIDIFDLILGNDKMINAMEKSVGSINDIKITFDKYCSENQDEDLQFYYPFIKQYPIMHKNSLLLKKYEFKKDIVYTGRYSNYLLPPNGHNLPTILQVNSLLRKEVGNMFQEYGLEFVLDYANSTFLIQKKSDGIVYQYPYSSMADTLQRMIFHVAAIESNKDSILLFEEPESHTYPPYIWELANRIVDDESNQYFIATHSPYLLNTILEKANPDEVSLFVTYYEDYQTKIKRLSNKEIDQLLDYKVDVFLNLESFIPQATS